MARERVLSSFNLFKKEEYIMEYTEFKDCKPGDILYHPNGKVIAIVVEENFWLKHADPDKIVFYNEKIGNRNLSRYHLLVRYLGPKIDVFDPKKSYDNGYSITMFDYLHHADVIRISVGIITLVSLVEVLSQMGKEKTEIIISELKGIINKEDSWLEAF